MDDEVAAEALETINFALAGPISNLDEASSALEEFVEDPPNQALVDELQRLLKIAYDASLELTGKVDQLAG